MSQIAHQAPLAASRRRLLAYGAAALGSTALAGRIASVRGAKPAEAKRAFPQHVTHAPGTIRLDHRSQKQQDEDVRAAYDEWKANYVVEAGTGDDGEPLYRIAFGKPGSENHPITVSEGQGFGMVIVPYLAGHDPDAQAIFDGLWGFAHANPSEIEPRLMNWHVPSDGNGVDSAFDGDCDIAYGLLLADAQWGSDGPVNYRKAALDVIAGILDATIGPRSHLPLLGDWVKADGPKYNQDTPRTSDFMPGHFRAFGRATGDAVWDDVVTACQRVVSTLQANYSPETGLLPDFVQPVSKADRSPRPAEPNFLEESTDGAFNYNAGRDPWRLGVDALLTGDAASLAQVSRIATWIESAAKGDPQRIRAGYELDGTPLDDSNYFTIFFAAPMGVAAMTSAPLQDWLNDLYDAVYATSEDYYEDTVALLSLLVMTGNWWEP